MTTEGRKDWRLVTLPARSNIFRHPIRASREFFTARRTVKEAEAVAAAVSRCEAVLEAVGPKAEAGAVARENASSSEAHVPEAARAAASRQLLLRLIKEEGALRRYLDGKEDEDPVQALAHAKGDVAYLNRLRSSDFLTFSSKAALGKAALPILIVLLTAVSANVVGVRLQSEYLQQNRRFEVRLERLREGQRLAGNLYASAADFKRRTERDEARRELALKPIPSLNDFSRDLRQIRNMVAGAPGDDIGKALLAANSVVNDTITCFGDQPENPKDRKGSCSENFKLEPFDDLQDTISSALVSYLE